MDETVCRFAFLSLYPSSFSLLPFPRIPSIPVLRCCRALYSATTESSDSDPSLFSHRIVFVETSSLSPMGLPPHPPSPIPVAQACMPPYSAAPAGVSARPPPGCPPQRMLCAMRKRMGALVTAAHRALGHCSPLLCLCLCHIHSQSTNSSRSLG